MELSERAQSTTLLAGIAILIIVVAGGIGAYVFVAQPGTAGTETTQTPASTPLPAGPGSQTPTATPFPTRAPVQTPTLTPTSSPISTPTSGPTPTATPVPTVNPNARTYDPFVTRYTVRAQQVVDLFDEMTLELRGSRIVGDELWLAVDLTAAQGNESKRMDQLNTTMDAFLLTVDDYNEDGVAGYKPSGIRVLEVNATSQDPVTYHVGLSAAEAYLDEDISYWEYRETWLETGRAQTRPERQTATEINGTWPTRTLAPDEENADSQDAAEKQTPGGGPGE